ncbi:phage head completion protein [Enterococcus avium]|uniref:phage head completion protein n=1 Tax=Enterococcus avium TaxID=33945 RepID=UPI001F5A6B38|nr:head-tail adaptor protein [Enterococcus avium]
MISRTGKLNKRLTFLIKDKIGVGPNGTEKYEYIPHFQTWFMLKQKTLNQIASESGTILEDTQTLVIRQRQKEEPKIDWRIRINNDDYKIININPDVDTKGFMVLSVRRIE